MKYLNPACQYWLITGPNGAVLQDDRADPGRDRQDYSGKLKVVKLNIDDHQKTPGEFGIRGIPTLMLFKGGNIEATKVGALSKSQLTAFIDSNL